MRRYKTRPIFRNRRLFGEMRLVKQMYSLDPDIFYKSFRMNTQQFDYILLRVGPIISEGRHLTDSISPQQRLAMTLR
jgi:hypothetical protein